MKKLFIIFALLLTSCGGSNTPELEFPPFTELNERPGATTDLEEIIDLETKALETFDATLCEQIGDQVQYIACRYNVIANLAIKYDDSSLCAEIVDPTYVQECEDLFE